MRTRHWWWPVMAACLLAPLAQAQTDNLWRFEYTGFSRDGVFLPDYRVSGSFVGNDADGNGVIEQAEISRFTWDDTWFDLQYSPYCVVGRCMLDGFSYRLDGALAFRFEWIYSDEMGYSAERTVAGESIHQSGYIGSSDPISITWNWTDQTRFTMNPPPVPEPHQYSMLAAGLFGVGALLVTGRRSRPRKGAPAAPRCLLG